MKKILAVFLCVVSLAALLSACVKTQQESSGYVISFECDGKQYEWKYTLAQEGIISVSEGLSLGDDGTAQYLFVFEAVGEGSTDIVFVCSEKESGRVVKTARYLVKTDADYNITANLISYKIEPETTENAEETKIHNKQEAENAAQKDILAEEPEREGTLLFRTKKNNGKYAVRVYSFDKENSTFAYLVTYLISENGILEKIEEDGIDDIIVSGK